MYTLYKFHFLNGISEINQLFDDILIIWPAPVQCFVLRDEVDELDNRHSGFWRSLLRWLWTVKTPLKMLATDAKNEKKKNRTRSEFFLWRTKISEAVCKRDWDNVRSYLFFNERKFQTKNSYLLEINVNKKKLKLNLNVKIKTLNK